MFGKTGICALCLVGAVCSALHNKSRFLWKLAEIEENLDFVLSNFTLRVGVLQGNDYDYDCWGQTRNKTVFIGDSYSQHILSLLQDVLHFEVEYFVSPSNTWTGLMNLVATARVDMAVCHWATSGQLPLVADFLLPTMESTESFVYLPHNLPLNRDVYIEMFSNKLWPFFLLSILVMIVSLRFSTSMHSCVRPDHEPWSWTEVVLWAIAAVSQQSYSRHPRGSSCRTMFLIGYSITYLLYTGFAAGVTSLLALQGHRNHLHLEDIAQKGLTLLLNKDEFYGDLLEKFSKTNKHSSKFIITTQYSELKHIFANIHHKNVVGLGSTETLANYLKKQQQRQVKLAKNVAIVPVPMSVQQKSFLVRKRFPHKRLFDYWILRIKETGLADASKKRHLPGRQSPEPGSTQWLSADLDNVFSAFAFLTGGWLASFLILLGEIFCKKLSTS